LDWLLIGSLWSDVADWIYVWGMVVVGLGLVIFIHELGHFLVAKACGVKCDKFYIGFDVPLGRFCNWLRGREGEWKPLGFSIPRTIGPRVKWGETEYGIGILPLGGYVKMLGQDDNPYAQEAEYDRARAADEAAEGSAGGEAMAASTATVTEATAPSEGSRWDPRSYLAKSIPQRMAIISAGVIMNVILAFVLASIAYGIGVPYRQAVVGHVVPGGTAWRHKWPVGARITTIAGIPNPRWEKEIVYYARMAEKGKTVEITYLDPRSGQLVTETIEPEMGADNLSRLGISSSYTLELPPSWRRAPAEPLGVPGTPAAEADFQGGDLILAVKAPGQDKPVEVSTYAQLQAQLVKHAGEMLELTVDRIKNPDAPKKSDEQGPVERHHATLLLAPAPMRDLGLVMKFGPITAVQPGSPAAEAGIKAGDEIVKVTGDGPDDVLSADPLFMPELLRRLAGKSVNVSLMREGQQITLDVKLREPRWSEEPTGTPDQNNNLTDEPMGAPALGIAYDVLNEIAAVSGPAEAAGLKAGQTISQVKFWMRLPRKSPDDPWPLKEITLPLGAKKHHWPSVFFGYLQDRAAPEKKVEISVGEKKEETVYPVAPFRRSDWFRSERGILLMPLSDVRVAGSLGEALKLGAQETGEAMSMVLTFLRRIRDLGQHAAGPLGIFTFAAGSVEAGFTQFLLFLAMLSANLAVVNILPIPVLDGGHLMFLAYEGIRRKPPSEKVMIGLNFLGLALILTVMVLVLTLDIGRLFGN
jgi:regulator of sigma E protease